MQIVRKKLDASYLLEGVSMAKVILPDDYRAVIYTDGATSPNPGPSGSPCSHRAADLVPAAAKRSSVIPSAAGIKQC